MRVLKDPKDEKIGIHLNDSELAYGSVGHGNATWGKYGTIYLSLEKTLAISIARRILSKFDRKEGGTRRCQKSQTTKP